MYPVYVHRYNYLTRRTNMYSLYDDPVVKRKHNAQHQIQKKASGKPHEYSKIVREEVAKLKEKYPNKFPSASHMNPLKNKS